MIWDIMGIYGRQWAEPSNTMGETNNFRLIPGVVGAALGETSASNWLLEDFIFVLIMFYNLKLEWNAGRADETGQTACKPGSVPARGQGTAIHLGRPLPGASRDQPGR